MTDTDPLVGSALGSFEILERIGRGATGTVYKARQQPLGRFVAVKTLHPQLATDAAFVERFYREARTAAKLHHGHIVQVHAVGEADGVHYIAMAYVEGGSLSDSLRDRGPLAPERGVALLEQACSALAAAHAAGVVHRDVKPSNLMLDANGSLRIADFGLAKPAAGTMDVTQAGVALGTPLYMAPEACAGRPADAASDLYSLGATFYHLLSGRPPFVGKSYSQLVLKHVKAAPKPLAGAAPHVDPRLAAIIDRLLAKAPAERFPSAEAVLAAVKALGPLEEPPAARRARGRALIVEAPTATMAPGQQLAREAAAQRHQPRSRKRLAALLSVATVLAAAVAWVWLYGPGRTIRDETKSWPTWVKSSVPATTVQSDGAATHTPPAAAPLPLPRKPKPKPAPLPLPRKPKPAPPVVAEGDFGPYRHRPIVPFYEDFQDTDYRRWTLTVGKSWRSRSGYFMYHRTSAGQNGFKAIDGWEYDNFTLEVDCTDTGDEVGFTFGVLFRQCGGHQLMLAVSTEYGQASLTAVNGFGPQPRSGVAGVERVKGGRIPFKGEFGSRIRLKVECIGTRVRGWVNGKLVGELADRALLSGRVALHVHRAAVHWHRVVLTPLATRPQEPDGELGRLWLARARRIEKMRRPRHEQWRAWADVLERFPQAEEKLAGPIRKERDGHVAQLAASWKWFSPLAERYQNRLLSAEVREISSGRLAVRYVPIAASQISDWETDWGDFHMHLRQRFEFCSGDSFADLNTLVWLYSHGDKVKFRCFAISGVPYGAFVFGLAGDPARTGIQLRVGPESQVGPAGEEPWFRERLGPDSKWHEHELEVGDGQFVYRRDGKVLHKRKVDIRRFRGRRLGLWSRGHKAGTKTHARFKDLRVIAEPQRDWILSRPATSPPMHRCDRPDARGWLGLDSPADGPNRCWQRRWWVSSWGSMAIISVRPGDGAVGVNTLMPSATNCVIAVTGELAPDRGPEWTERVAVWFRNNKQGYVHLVLPRRGGAWLELKRGRDKQTVARNPAFVLPDGIFRLVVIADGPRLDAYCNGEHVLSHEGVDVAAGRLGVDIKNGAAIIHDTRFRLLPGDPLYAEIYGGGHP